MYVTVCVATYARMACRDATALVHAKIDPKIDAKIDPKIDPKIDAKIDPKIDAKIDVHNGKAFETTKPQYQRLPKQTPSYNNHQKRHLSG